MQFWIANVAIHFGQTLADLGRAEEGVAHSLRGAALLDQMSTKVNLGSLRTRHAMTLLLAGRKFEAREEAERALRISRTAGERAAEPYALVALGRVLLASDSADVETVSARYLQGLAIAEELDMRPMTAYCHFDLGRLHAKVGDRGKAREHFASAATMYREMDMQSLLQRAEAELASL
jgi:tetratricopeptide (TPR) repeat protein